MRATSIVALVAALAPAVLAGPYFTAPVAGTVCQAGQPCVITWQDDGKAPSLPEFGDCSVDVYTGNSQQQTKVQTLAITNAQTAQTVQFVPDPNAGEDSQVYFIKMVSIGMADPTNAMYKASAYSAMFTLKGMTGKFNDTVKAQIAGTPAPSSTPAGTTTATPSASNAKAASSTATTSSNSTSNSTSNNATNANGAGSVTVAAMGVFGASVLAALAAVL